LRKVFTSDFHGMAAELLGSARNRTCGSTACDAVCEACLEDTCELLPCYDIPAGKCHCPRLSSETLVAVGAVGLCLILLLLSMCMWHWRQCGEFRTSLTITDSQTMRDSLLGGERHLGGALRLTVGGRGRTSLDSAVSCIVCMDYAINCILMPCAHEVACLRCAQRVGLCPICRTAVDSVMRIALPTDAQLAAAVRDARTSEGLASAEALVDPLPALPAALIPTALPTAPPPDAEEGGAAADAPADATPETAAFGAEGMHPKAGTMAQMLCLRCAAEPPNCVFLPCSHKVWCTGCAAQLPAQCPICNTGITQSLRTFHKRF
jgi:hypothetical protein